MKNDTRIPRTIHYIWVGGNPKPDSVNKYIETWKKYCPDYEIKEWNEKNYDVTKNRYCREAYEAKKWAFVTDYMRLDILDKEGGIYMDSDVEILKNLDNFLNEPAFSSFEAGDPTNIFLPTGMMGSEKGGAWVKYLKSYYDKDRSFYKENGQPDTTTNTNIITNMTEKKYGIKLNNKLQKFEDFTMFPSDYFCPKSWSTGDIKLTKNTHTIHHFAMSWVSDNEKKYIDFMRNTKVSIIIPIYNVEKYLEECIDSAINQTYSNLEIILVDDKSPDSSGKISDKYAKKDDRIKVIHKRNNGGLSAARNTGIKYSTGDLLMFVDSDDILHRDAVSILSNKLLKTDSDLIYFEFDTFTDKPDFNKWLPPASKYMENNEVFSLKKMPGKNRFMPFSASACKLFVKKEILIKNNIAFNESIKRCEDYPFFYGVLVSSEKISYINKALYFYRQSRDGSITSDSKNIEYFIVALEETYKFLENHNVWNEFKDDFRNLLIHYLYHYTTFYDMNEDYIKFAKKMLNKIKMEEFLRKNINENENARILFSSIIKDEYKDVLIAIRRLTPPNYKYLKFTHKKRILCPTIFGTMNGGGERSSYVLWRWLNKYYDIVIALPKDTNREYLDTCERDGINYVLCDYEHSIENIRMQFDFVKMIYDLKIDIVFPAIYLESALSAAAATNTPAVFLDYGLIGLGVDDESYQPLVSGRLRMSNIIITNSLWGVSAVNEFAARRSIYAPSYTEKPDILVKKSGKTRLIYPARIDAQQKAQLDLARAAKLLCQDGIENEVIIMGGYEPKWSWAEKYYKSIVKYINKNGLERRVKLPGWVADPFSKFNENDIYVTTTKYEAVGRATLEAVELGIPVLIPDIPGHREFKEIIGMSDEHFYEPGNLVDFKEKAEYLINHIDEAKKRAKEYAKIAEEKFSEENCNKDILSALHDIEGKGNPGVNFWADQQIELMRDYDERMQIINSLRSDVTDLNNQLSSFLSTKRAVKLAAGNFLRHIRRRLGRVTDQ